MSENPMKENPFAVQTPESIRADAVVELFVNSFTDFPKLETVGHTFVHGPRGSGKSMMFRFMQPDCQAIARHQAVHELPYFGAYVPIKNMEANVVELRRFENHGGNYIFNEHVLCSYILIKLLYQFKEHPIPFVESQSSAEECRNVYEVFLSRLRAAGLRETIERKPVENIAMLFGEIAAGMVLLWERVRGFIQSVAMEQAAIESYDGALCTYQGFLLPILSAMQSSLSAFPRGPVFLMLDDAGYLNTAQTRVLNSWISTRTSAAISLKVSTQYDYKSFHSFSGQRIEAPHDFSEINIATVYTSNREQYRDRVREIVHRRLDKAGIHAAPETFFPEDPAQAAAILAIDAELRNRWPDEGRGHRARDDANRYARPDFIKSLGGARKAGSTYSYSGFEQLVHVSSSIIRYFLEPASQMYSEARAALSEGAELACIPPGIQNRVIRDAADRFLHADFEDHARGAENEPSNRFRQLENLLNAMGETFHACLVSDRSEWRVFSIALSDRIDEEVKAVLELGIRLGYLQHSTIGNKRGTGRVPQYILSRRVAPCFNLDPTSFAGYLFVTNARLRQAMSHPRSWLRDFQRLGSDALDEEAQLALNV